MVRRLWQKDRASDCTGQCLGTAVGGHSAQAMIKPAMAKQITVLHCGHTCAADIAQTSLRVPRAVLGDHAPPLQGGCHCVHISEANVTLGLDPVMEPMSSALLGSLDHYLPSRGTECFHRRAQHLVPRPS